MKNTATNPMMTTVIAAVAALIVGFFGGMKYQSTKIPTFSRQGSAGGQTMMFRNGGDAAQRALPGGRGQNRPVTGTVTSADDTSITVKMPDGSSKIVLVTKLTQINTASEATKEDITTGTTVAVFGTSNPDGSVTALNIQLNPNFSIRAQGSGPTGTSGAK